MHSVIIGFRYASSRWLALVGLSLISFFLVLKHLPLLRTLVVRIYRQKIIAQNQYTCTHKSQQFMHSILHKQGVSETNKFRKQNKVLISKSILLELGFLN
jgi:hypothetical protein